VPACIVKLTPRSASTRGAAANRRFARQRVVLDEVLDLEQRRLG
jgi:hypothetical protein